MYFLLPLGLTFSVLAGSTGAAHLKTRNVASPELNGLYVYAYHTGAAANDAALTSDVEKASPVVFGGTDLQIDLRNGLKWGLTMDYDKTLSPANEPVHISPGPGSGGFHSGSKGVSWENKDFKGWRVCGDGPHNAPQLYWHNGQNPDMAQVGCADAELELVA